MGKAKILVIDDEKEILALLKEQLEFRNYEVITSTDGDDGLRKARELRPNLVICDINMPKKDGFIVLRELRETQMEHVPFIMLTVLDGFHYAKKSYDYQADFYVAKPVEIGKLVKNIRILLSLSKERIQ